MRQLAVRAIAGPSAGVRELATLPRSSTELSNMPAADRLIMGARQASGIERTDVRDAERWDIAIHRSSIKGGLFPPTPAARFLGIVLVPDPGAGRAGCRLR